MVWKYFRDFLELLAPTLVGMSNSSCGPYSYIRSRSRTYRCIPDSKATIRGMFVCRSRHNMTRIGRVLRMLGFPLTGFPSSPIAGCLTSARSRLRLRRQWWSWAHILDASTGWYCSSLASRSCEQKRQGHHLGNTAG